MIATNNRNSTGSTSGARSIVTAARGVAAQLIVSILILCFGLCAQVQAAVEGPEDASASQQRQIVKGMQNFWKGVVSKGYDPQNEHWDDLIVLASPNWRAYVASGKLKPSQEVVNLRRQFPTGRAIWLKVKTKNGVVEMERYTLNPDDPEKGFSPAQLDAAVKYRKIGGSKRGPFAQ